MNPMQSDSATPRLYVYRWDSSTWGGTSWWEPFKWWKPTHWMTEREWRVDDGQHTR